MKCAVALEGGGARGAYHMGAIKALMEMGYEISAISGTSIGAINGAMIVQGDFDKAYKIWDSIKYSTLFDIDDEKLKRALDIDLDIDVVKYLSKKLTETLKNKGIDTKKIRKILEENIDEEKVRNSNILYGLVTICVSDRKAKELFIDQIEEGKLIDYIMASSCLPIFKNAKIDDKSYLDGGFFDNCPVNMLIEKGYKEIFAIRVHKKMRIRNYKNIVKTSNVNIHMIESTERLPSILGFDSNISKDLLKRGYFDTLKTIKGLDGKYLYIKKEDEEFYFKKICNLQQSCMRKILGMLGIRFEREEQIRKKFLDQALEQMVYNIGAKGITTYKELLITLVEYVAKINYFDRYKLYSFDEVLKNINETRSLNVDSKQIVAIYELLKNM